MFTGIVQGIAQVARITDKDGLRSFTLDFPDGFCRDLEIGASVACDGDCLTVTALDGDHRAEFDVMLQSLNLTTLGQLGVGGRLELESYQPLTNGTEFTAAGWNPADGRLYVGSGTTLRTYDYTTNTRGSAIAIGGLVSGGIGSLPQPAVGWPAFISLILIYFSMSYLLIGATFLGIGAHASTAREVQILSMPVTMAQLVLFGFASLAVGRPNSSEAISSATVAAIAAPTTTPPMIGVAARDATVTTIRADVAPSAWRMPKSRRVCWTVCDSTA